MWESISKTREIQISILVKSKTGEVYKWDFGILVIVISSAHNF